MKVGVVGAGSIGLLFAAYLSDSFEVILYTRSHQQAEEIRDKGIVLKTAENILTKKVNALPIEEWVGNEDFVIVTVKQYQLEALIQRINSIPNRLKSVLFLQNGMGHLPFLPNLNAVNIFVGSIEHGASKENNHTVRHNGAGVTRTALYQGELEILQSFLTKTSPEFVFTYEDNYLHMLQSKLVVNAVINPLSAVLRVRNGLLVENPFFFSLVKELFNEIANILDLQDREAYFKKIVNICHSTSQNTSSMLKDIKEGRKTEVDAILGYLIRTAHDKGKSALLTYTLEQTVRGMEYEMEELKWEL